MLGRRRRVQRLAIPRPAPANPFPNLEEVGTEEVPRTPGRERARPNRKPKRKLKFGCQRVGDTDESMAREVTLNEGMTQRMKSGSVVDTGGESGEIHGGNDTVRERSVREQSVRERSMREPVTWESEHVGVGSVPLGNESGSTAEGSVSDENYVPPAEAAPRPGEGLGVRRGTRERREVNYAEMSSDSEVNVQAVGMIDFKETKSTIRVELPTIEEEQATIVVPDARLDGIG